METLKLFFFHLIQTGFEAFITLNPEQQDQGNDRIDEIVLQAS